MDEVGMDGSGQWPEGPDADVFLYESDVREWDAEIAGWVPPRPDAVALVLEASDLEAVFAAQRFARVDDLRLEALDDVSRYGGGSRELVMRSLRLELAAALRITENAAGMMLARAESLVHSYPTVLESLSRSGVTVRHAEILVDDLDVLDREVAARLVGRALGLAQSLPVGSFRRALRRLIERETAPTLTERHEVAVRGRRIMVEPAGDSMSWVHALVPSVEAHAIFGRVTQKAVVIRDHDRGSTRGGESDGSVERSLDEIRADVFCDLLIDGTVPQHPKQARGIQATVVVTVPALALLGVEGVTDPAEVEGVGPIPIDTARELASGASGWMRVLTHPETGAVISVGRTRYRPPPELAKLVKWRADRCMGPGCSKPASQCQIDHSVAWEHGGETSVTNTAPLCQGHHTVRHHGGWVITHLDDGSLEWGLSSLLCKRVGVGG
ncbi:MAG: hypothetical protein BGO47_08175 [Microbacterium sp. 67-17]|uniref:HNH endonuclease signature motif containing protein n=1 Tax=Microbacterium sp. 67-17 TaxID=1895782 RepID=UPI0009657924|nr:HNH endonuclease signature motif containing protein [Microbacterium sp. 67-17]OJW00016.1 MAG: hypothetical protein BGO47_08175 [Microbacterium sp. 67-17]